MFVVCPDCGADQQEVGKYCENCGRLITAADVAAGRQPPAPPPPPPASNPWDPPVAAPPPAAPPSAGPWAPTSPWCSNGQAIPAEGFTLTQPGEFLVGRPNNETGTGVDIDLRQWVQPLDIRRPEAIPGASQPVLPRPDPRPARSRSGAARASKATRWSSPSKARPSCPCPNWARCAPSRPDSTYPLHPGDRVYMGDPDAILANQSGDPRAAGTFLILELLRDATCELLSYV